MDQKRQRKLFKKLKTAGWRLKAHTKGMKCLSPDGKKIVVVHTSPSDHRADRNLLSEFKRAGFDDNV